MRHPYDYVDDLSVGRVSLEMSLKPFRNTSAEEIDRVCRMLFRQWSPLLRYASSAAVMFWTADGSEILEYTGDLSMSFQWCNWIGMGHPRKREEDITEDQEWYNLHVRHFPYEGKGKDREMTYGDLKRIVAAVRRIGEEMTGLPVSVIETFDPGPEFAVSDFKFNRHREISEKGKIVKGQWVDCAALLHAENKHYAAYPDGIPEGTPFGEFLGRQLMSLKNDVGFDSIWLSNGLGFSLNAWSWRGDLFNGERFDFTGAAEVRKGINAFWKAFTGETGNMLIETRGSNLTTGMDIAAHGCPIDAIYSYPMLTPPNSPWAALDYRFGLELCGYLSHIAETSAAGYLFRYYTHDPWWQNSPWFDRYGRSPHDIYLPLSLARIAADGTVTKPYGINFLSADDSFGNLPEKCPTEVIPHLLEAYNTWSDAPGALTWLYPFETYCELGLRQGHMDRMMMDDWFVEAAVDRGLPLNTVVSDRNFVKSDTAIWGNTILLTPVPEEGTLAETCVLRAIDAKIPLVLYGSTVHASDALRGKIGVLLGDGLTEEELAVSDYIADDTFESGSVSSRLVHEPLVSNGTVCEISDGSGDVLADVTDSQGNTRTYALASRKERIVWIRGSFPHITGRGGALPPVRKPSEYYSCGGLLRRALSRFGLSIRFRAFSPDEKLPLLLFSAREGGYYLTSFAKDTTITTSLKTRFGAPLPDGCEAIVENDTAYMPAKKWQHDELRVFVKQKERSCISNLIMTPGDTLLSDRRRRLFGLRDADVTFLAPPNAHVIFREVEDGEGYWQINCIFKSTCSVTQDGNRYTAHGINGTVEIVWQTAESREELKKNGYMR